jgi:hypothetical protein
MKTKYLFKYTILLLLLASISCEKDDPDTQEPGLISLSQASQEYVLDEDEGTIQFTLAVSLSGQDNPEAFSVEVQSNLILLKQKMDEMEGAVAMPADLYNVPETVEVPDGQQTVDFHLTINRNMLIEKYSHLYDKHLVIAVKLAKPSRYSIDEAHATVAVTINSIDVMPEPQEPEEPVEPEEPEGPEVPAPEPEPEGNLIKGGDFGTGSEQYWTIINGDEDEAYHEDMAMITNGYLKLDYGTDEAGATVMVYQKIELEKDKRYKLTADFSSTGGATNQLFQLIIDYPQPVERVWYDEYRPGWENEILFQYIDNWQPEGLGNKLKGKLQEIAPWVVNIDRPSGEFDAKFSGEGYIILRFGSWNSPGSIIIDNLYLVEM